MTERDSSTLIFKKEVKLPAAMGDWTVYRPLKTQSKRSKPGLYGSSRVSKKYLDETLKCHLFFTLELSKFLKTSLKASTDVLSVSVEQMTYLDYLKSVTGGIVYNKLNLKDIGDALFIIDYQLANIVINFSLGFQSVDTKVKEFTDIEESIIQSVFGNLLSSYAAAWKNIFEKPTLDIISFPSIQRETHINLNEIITVVTSQVSIANSMPTFFSFVYQNNTIKKLNELYSKKISQTPLNFGALNEDLQNSIEVPMITLLGTTSVPATDLVSIEIEDVISLDQRLNDPIKTLLGNSAELKTQPGIINDRYCIKVLPGGISRTRSTITKQSTPSSSISVSRPVTVSDTDQTPENSISTQNSSNELELPMEDEEKEVYNEIGETLDDENSNSGLGGK